MTRFRLERFEYTDTDNSILFRLRGDLYASDPEFIARSAVLVLRRGDVELQTVPPLRGSTELSRLPGRAVWAAGFGIPRSAVTGRRRHRHGIHRPPFAGRRHVEFELRAEGLQPVTLPMPQPIPRLELARTRRPRHPLRFIPRGVRARFRHVPEAVRLPALSALAAAGAAAIALAVAPGQYSAEALLLASPLSTQDPALTGLPILRSRGDQSPSFQTARDEVAAVGVARATALTLGPGWSTRSVQRSITVGIGPSPALIAVTGHAETPQRALRLTQAYVTTAFALREGPFRAAVSAAVTKAREQLTAVIAARLSPDAINAASQQVLELTALSATGEPTIAPARRPRVLPRTGLSHDALIILLSAFCGVVLGAFANLLSHQVARRSVTRLRRVRQLTELPILATLPPAESIRLPADAEEGNVAQALSGLLTLLGWEQPAPRSIAFISAGPGEGTTTAALAVAGHASSQGHFVGVLDLDWFTLGALEELNLRPRQRAARAHDWFEAMEHTKLGRTMLVSASLGPPDSDDVRGALDRARAMADLVVVDTPPIGISSDALVAATVVDAVVLVVSLEKTGEPGLREACAALRRAGVEPTGTVVFSPRGVEAYAHPRARSRRTAGSRPAALAMPSSAGPSASSTQSR